jgi:hypothetical protein
MPIPQTKAGLYGGPAGIITGSAPPPILSVAFALQCEGVPQQFPAEPQQQRISLGNEGFSLSVQVLDQDGNPINIAAASALSLVVVWPGGQIQVIPAAFVTNGTDGQVGATLGSGLSGGWGLYYVSARVTLANQILQTQSGRLWYVGGAP